MEFLQYMLKLQSNFDHNYKTVIYGSVKFYGTGPWNHKLCTDILEER